MNSTAVTTLTGICESVRYGYTASACEIPCGPQFLRITDIVPDSINWSSVPYCEIDESDKERFDLTIGDIVVARTGATVGYAKLIREEVDAVFASYLVRFRIDKTKANPGFVGRLVESEIYKNYVKSRIGGAAQPNASAPVLGGFELNLPSISAQTRIASILSSYDDLIENNRRRMVLLEEAARQLYQEWFVRLKFPGHEHTRIIDGVPEGWERVLLGEHITLNYGKALKADDREDGPYPVYGSSGIVGSHEEVLSQGPGIILGRKGNVGSVYWTSKGFYAIDTVYYINTDASNLYLFYVLKHMHFINTDVAVPGLNRDMAYSRTLFLPSKSIFHQFLDAVAPIYEQLDKLEETNTKLKAARDILLPRLMSGEINV
jgi:type I restriction enzyme, S subunit